MKKFGYECIAKPKRFGDGTQWRFKFDNGYGASVVNDGYGKEEGLFELAVLNKHGIDYSTPITSDVEGYLKKEDVHKLLIKISSLFPKTKNKNKNG